MNNTNRMATAPIRLKQYAWIVAGFWTAAVAAAIAWELVDEWNHGLEVAQSEARGALKTELALRHWNASHGGVYVPASKESPPNPYLDNVPERDVTTSSHRLTLVNPAHMIRQIHEIAEGEEINVSVPMASVWPGQQKEMIRRAASYGGVWLLGLCGIVVASRRFQRHIELRQRAEEALCESQARIREIAANIPGVVYQFLRQPDGTYSFPYVSEGITRILGMTPEEVQRDPPAFFPGLLFNEDFDPILQSIDESAEKMTTWQREMQCRSTGGEIKWIRAISNPHAMPDGGVLWNGVFLDITNLKRTQKELQGARDALEHRVAQRTAELEQANRDLQREIAERTQAEQWLLESEERFRSYFELGLVGMAVISPEKEWLEVNRRLCEILCYTETEISAKSWDELTHPDDIEDDKVQLRRVLTGVTKGYTVDRRFLRKDGQTVHAHLCVRRLHRSDGSVDSLLVLVHDITQRKKAEEALRRSRSFLQAVIDAVPDITVVIDRQRRVVLANRAARESAKGVDPVTSGLSCHQLYHHCDTPCDENDSICPLKRVVEAKAPVTVIHTHRDADGKESVVEISAAPIFDENGEVVQVVESSRDVTDRKRTEEAADEAQTRLLQYQQRETERVTTELEKLRDQVVAQTQPIDPTPS